MAVGSEPARRPRIDVRHYGRLPDGQAVHEYTLDNGCGLRLRAINLGGIVTAIECPDREGRPANVVLGFGTLAGYVEPHPHFGTLVGRYANRIAGAHFVLDGKAHRLSPNDGPNTLHGGPGGYGRRWWSIDPMRDAPDGGVGIELRLTSPDDDEHFPGRLEVSVRYTLTPDNAWRVDYRATTDRPTVLNLTHHGYYNLAGAGSALNHTLVVNASHFVEVNEELIPTRIAPVADTPFDFRDPMPIGSRIRQGHVQLLRARGYDHCYVLDRVGSQPLQFAARLADAGSGRVMEVHTTQPGLQLYSGNFLDGRLLGAGGEAYRQGDAVCLETQHLPDSPNRPDFPSTVLRPGELFESTTVHRFSTG